MNALTLAELLFSLSASNGKLERVFSQLNVVKSNKRTSLTTDTLDDLLMVSTMNCALEDFNPDHAIDVWWVDKPSGPTQKQRKQYKRQSACGEGTDQPYGSTASDSEEE